MLNFLALGFPVGLLLICRATSKIGRPWRLLGLILGSALLLGVAYFIATPKALSDDVWCNRSPWKEGLLLITMLAGMAARSLDQAIELRSRQMAQLQDTGTRRRKPRLRLDSWDFSRPFLVALPTFGGLLGQIDDQDLGWVLITLAFQTGFFWQTVLKKSAPGAE